MAARKKVDFEQQIQRLQEIVIALEAGNLPLEKSVALYKEGVLLARSSREQLQTARNDVRIATEEGLKPFNDIASNDIASGEEVHDDSFV